MGVLILTVYSMYNSKGVDFLKPEDGYIYKLVDVTIENIGEKSVSTGRKLGGEVAFEVPEDAEGLELLFEPNVFGFVQAIVKIE